MLNAWLARPSETTLASTLSGCDRRRPQLNPRPHRATFQSCWQRGCLLRSGFPAALTILAVKLSRHPQPMRASSAARVRVCLYCRLPVQEVMSDVLAVLEEAPHGLVLVSPTGSGKTTGVPPALAEACASGALPEGIVLVTEPRRVAARAVAQRMATMRGEEVGGFVGYRTRFDSNCHPTRSRIQIVTEGILVSMLESDSLLSRVSVVVLDEFHERGLPVDLALAMCIKVRAARKAAHMSPLHVVVMSATLTVKVQQEIAGLLGGASIVESGGRAFKVDIMYEPAGRDLLRASAESDGFETHTELIDATVQGIMSALQKTNGDVLCFLPGVKEITVASRQFTRVLYGKVQRHGRPSEEYLLESRDIQHDILQRIAPVDVLPLHGSLPAEEQDAAVKASQTGRRKVVLATNVAEASITVNGITAVVDSGLRKRPRFDESLGLDVLETVAISQASADQRAGRAGRLCDGICIRLWDPDLVLKSADAPEIEEVELAGTVLSLAAQGVHPEELRLLPWLTKPPVASVQYAFDLLTKVGALSKGGFLTNHGRAMSQVTMHPRLAHMALLAPRVARVLPAASRDDAVGSIIEFCAALLTTSRVLPRHSKGNPADIRCLLSLLLPRRGDTGRSRVSAQQVKSCMTERTFREFRRLTSELQGLIPSGVEELATMAMPGDLLALAFPERVGRKMDQFFYELKDGTILRSRDPQLSREKYLAVARFKGKTITMAAPTSEMFYTGEAQRRLAKEVDVRADVRKTAQQKSHPRNVSDRHRETAVQSTPPPIVAAMRKKLGGRKKYMSCPNTFYDSVQ